MKEESDNTWFGVSQSLPNQVNDFNKRSTPPRPRPPRRRNPFQTRSTTSIRPGPARPGRPDMSQSLPNQVNDFNARAPQAGEEDEKCRNPFQTRSTTSILRNLGDHRLGKKSRNPFQTRSTTSIRQTPMLSRRLHVSQSLPNQVNDFNKI